MTTETPTCQDCGQPMVKGANEWVCPPWLKCPPTGRALILADCGHRRWVPAAAPLSSEQRRVEKDKPCPECAADPAAIVLAELEENLPGWVDDETPASYDLLADGIVWKLRVAGLLP